MNLYHLDHWFVVSLVKDSRWNGECFCTQRQRHNTVLKYYVITSFDSRDMLILLWRHYCSKICLKARNSKGSSLVHKYVKISVDGGGGGPCVVPHCPFCWVTDTPVLDFWWHLLSVSKLGWMPPCMLSHLHANRYEFLRFTSSATAADLLMATMAASCVSNICFLLFCTQIKWSSQSFGNQSIELYLKIL